jgi:hypothetical protein
MHKLKSTILLALLVLPVHGLAQTPPPPDTAPPVLRIQRATGPISVDGSFDDAGWQGVAVIDTWYETNPGDNVVPKVRTRGRITYTADSLYIAIEFDDPDPGAIRAPLGDRDNVSRETDYGGVIIDPTDSGRTAVLLLANPRNVQYDSISDDASGNEDASPDLFWDSATKFTSAGWQLEIRVPFSSLSYSRRDPQPFRLMLYRNYPREFRYQTFTTTLPRDVSCFICRANPVLGLTGLPAGGGIVVAPYASGSWVGTPEGDVLGAPLDYDNPDVAIGVDAKWRPTAGAVVDVTVNPDFSQIESDVAQIAANERFALLFPERRPFFLEGVELLQTPITAVNTRSLTDPQWGARGTVKYDKLAFTALAVQDEGGGSVIIPGAVASDLAEQDFRSWAGIVRARYDLGPAFIGALGTTREVQGGGFNRLGGLDFQWRPTKSDNVAGQFLYSFTRTPDRPELADEWDGRWLAGHGALLRWGRSGQRFDIYGLYRDISEEFRADDGFVPQVGIREVYGEAGYTIRPESGRLRRLRLFSWYDRFGDRDFDLLSHQLTAGASADAFLGSSIQLRYAYDQILVGDELLPRHQAVYNVSVNPGAIVSRIDLFGSAGQQIDFTNARTGTGVDVNLGVIVRPFSHLELQWNEGLRWVDVDVAGQPESRLFTARVDRLRATYSFTARLFLRLTGQYEVTRRTRELFLDPTTVSRKDAVFAGSLLFSYKLNWQSVVFVGYGDSRTFLEATDQLETDSRQFFVKLSRAFQW